MAHHEKRSKTQTAVVLQGGGALGAYELGALKRLYEEPDFQPDIVSGVSIGAVNAAVLVGARGDPIETLGELWERFAVRSSPLMPDCAERFLSLFGNLSFFTMRLDVYNALRWTSFYSTEPLRRELARHVDFAKLNASDTELIVTATDIADGSLSEFDNRRNGSGSGITVDHILASASLPPSFPMTAIDGRYLWDGGLFHNTPLSPVIKRLQPDRETRLIVINVFPTKGQVPDDMLGVLDRTFELLFANHMEHDIANLRRINRFVRAMDEIDAALPKGSAVRRHDEYRELRKYRTIQEVVIENREPEIVFAPFDFSRASIERRISAGYEDAKQALKAA